MSVIVRRSDLAHTLSLARECGTCTACCTLKAIPEMQSPAYEPCSMVCDRGCRIHGQHPPQCKTYQCLWRAGRIDGDERRRPDNLGIMFDIGEGALHPIVAWEVEPNVHTQHRVQHLIGTIANGNVIITRLHGTQTGIIQGPKWVRDQLLLIMSTDKCSQIDALKIFGERYEKERIAAEKLKGRGGSTHDGE